MPKVISIPPSEEELRELYPQYTIREIAKIKGVSHSTVVNWLKKYNIPLERVGARGGQGTRAAPEIDKPESDEILEFVDYAKGTLRKIAREIGEFNRRLELLQEFRHLKAEEALRLSILESALAMERDNMLYRILAEVGCRDDALEVAYKMFEDALELDTETDIWYFVDEKTGDDGTQDLVAAIKERLPDYLKVKDT